MHTSTKVRGAGLAVLALFTAGIVVGPSGPAHADGALTAQQRADLRWYAEWENLEQIHRSGITGKGVKIAVVEDFLNPDLPEFSGADIRIMGSACNNFSDGSPKKIVSADPAAAMHGSNVVGAIVGNGTAGDGGPGMLGSAPGAEIMFYGLGGGEQSECKIADPTVEKGGIDLTDDIGLFDSGPVDERVTQGNSNSGLVTAVRAAIRDGADIVSLSVIGGMDWDQVAAESQIHGVPILVGVENPDVGFLGGLSTIDSTNGFITVNAVDRDGQVQVDSQGLPGKGSSLMTFASPGAGILGVSSSTAFGPAEIYGTSFATPLTAGMIALGMQKHPGATAFQVLQAMVRSTGRSVHEPDWIDDQMGYGYANIGVAIDVDPTRFPDESPTLVKDITDPRCGSSAKVDAEQSWFCEWTVGPSWETIEAYRAVVQDGADVVDLYGKRVPSVYGPGGRQDPQGPLGVWAVAAWILFPLLGLIVIGVVVAVLVIAARRRRPAAATALPQAGPIPVPLDPQPLGGWAPAQGHVAPVLGGPVPSPGPIPSAAPAQSAGPEPSAGPVPSAGSVPSVIPPPPVDAQPLDGYGMDEPGR